MGKMFLLVILATVLPGWLLAQPNASVAHKPPMGWNSWNCFRENISAEKIKGIADAMVASGMKNAGYEYVVIDDGWMTDKRDSQGHIIVDSIKFPNGIKAVADYVHSLGLKFGIYSAPGRFTCQKLMGSYEHEQIDANDYAAWGVDYLKYDWCNYPGTREQALNTPAEECRQAYELMGDCLKNTGRPIIYSVHSTCSGEQKNSYPWVVDVVHMHRSGGDIKDNWDRMLYCLEGTADLWSYARPGFWNDPDMLEVGNTTQERLWGGIDSTKMTTLEYRTHFSMWCMVAAPLIAGNNLTTMKDEITQILTNKEVIAINQDPLGKQGRRVRDDGELEVWVKELSGNRRAVALLNRSDETVDIAFSWEEAGISGEYSIRNLWTHQNLGEFQRAYQGTDIASHDALVLLLEPK
ncbi:MAG: glycoside hydrolase family 27 protein [Cyclobacteriaceae bacterium]